MEENKRQKWRITFFSVGELLLPNCTQTIKQQIKLNNLNCSCFWRFWNLNPKQPQRVIKPSWKQWRKWKFFFVLNSLGSQHHQPPTDTNFSFDQITAGTWNTLHNHIFLLKREANHKRTNYQHRITQIFQCARMWVCISSKLCNLISDKLSWNKFKNDYLVTLNTKYQKLFAHHICMCRMCRFKMKFFLLKVPEKIPAENWVENSDQNYSCKIGSKNHSVCARL